jgi:hypothetical protein
MNVVTGIVIVELPLTVSAPALANVPTPVPNVNVELPVTAKVPALVKLATEVGSV